LPIPYGAKAFEWRASVSSSSSSSSGGGELISGSSVRQETGELLVNVSAGYRGGRYYCALTLDSGKIAISVHNVIGNNCGSDSAAV
jgi:hypothetical protein